LAPPLVSPVLLFLLRPPPTSTLFPYTTLFRSSQTLVERLVGLAQKAAPSAELVLVGRSPAYDHLGLLALADRPSNVGPLGGLNRSEEHTSELQSRENLVCRLLLEKKKPTHQLS